MNLPRSDLFDDHDLIATRLLPAAPAAAYANWTEAHHLECWWGPPGAPAEVLKLECWPGGEFIYRVRVADAPGQCAKWTFRELVPARRLEFVLAFCDVRGIPAPHPTLPNWPHQTLVRVSLTAHENASLASVSWSPLEAAPRERDAFLDAHLVMRETLRASLDALAAHMASAPQLVSA